MERRIEEDVQYVAKDVKEETKDDPVKTSKKHKMLTSILDAFKAKVEI